MITIVNHEILDHKNSTHKVNNNWQLPSKMQLSSINQPFLKSINKLVRYKNHKPPLLQSRRINFRFRNNKLSEWCHILIHKRISLFKDTQALLDTLTFSSWTLFNKVWYQSLLEIILKLISKNSSICKVWLLTIPLLCMLQLTQTYNKCNTSLPLWNSSQTLTLRIFMA